MELIRGGPIACAGVGMSCLPEGCLASTTETVAVLDLLGTGATWEGGACCSGGGKCG